MSKSVSMVDANTTQRRRLINDLAHSEDSLIEKLMYRVGIVLKQVKEGLISVSNSPKALASCLAAGALIGFAAASGAFTMQSSNIELAANQVQVQSVSATGQADKDFDMRVGSLIKRSKDIISGINNNFVKNPDFAKRCMSGDHHKDCNFVRDQLTTAARMINAADAQITGYAEVGGQVSDKSNLGVEQAIANLKTLNKTYPGLFGPEDRKQFDHGNQPH